MTSTMEQVVTAPLSQTASETTMKTDPLAGISVVLTTADSAVRKAIRQATATVREQGYPKGFPHTRCKAPGTRVDTAVHSASPQIFTMTRNGVRISAVEKTALSAEFRGGSSTFLIAVPSTTYPTESPVTSTTLLKAVPQVFSPTFVQPVPRTVLTADSMTACTPLRRVDTPICFRTAAPAVPTPRPTTL